jgi:hypothetical protein
MQDGPLTSNLRVASRTAKREKPFRKSSSNSSICLKKPLLPARSKFQNERFIGRDREEAETIMVNTRKGGREEENLSPIATIAIDLDVYASNTQS